MTVATFSDSVPMFHYDFVRTAGKGIPSAHINVHASNDSAVKVMLGCGGKNRGKARRKRFVDSGFFPTFSTLHFPVGGDRFRPGLEDVLEMLIREFGIDAEDHCLDAIKDSRKEYRERQLRALVREFPQIVYDELIQAGHDLAERPAAHVSHASESRLTKY
ncbi:hypothetical protein [Bifidobacterium aquikefiricola]|uniref:Uncharacterized protein n=1 Tax=Bifidobacterium aquikefiricola TaxID=3059038 RepID=A0AB39U416_9BIFI